MNCSMPGFPVLHSLPEFAQTRVHWVSDAIQSSHPLLPLSPLVLNLSGSFPMSWLFGWFTSSDQSLGASASVLPMSIQGWFPLGFTGLISLLSKGLSRVFSSTTSPKASILHHPAFFMGFPGGASDKEPACQCRRHQRYRFDLWVGNILWRRAWHPLQYSWESQGLRSPVGYSP